MLGFIDSRLKNVNLLEPSNHTLRTREVTVIFLVGRRADKADGACFQIGFQHVRGVHGSLASGTGSHQCMNLVDIDDVVVALLLDAIHNHLDAVFEVATILRASQQRSHVKLVYPAAHQSFGHLSLFNHPCQSPHEGCLAHARLSHVQRIVLVPTAQYLNGALQFLLATDQRILFLIQVVHAGHQFLPRGIRLLFVRIRFQQVV